MPESGPFRHGDCRRLLRLAQFLTRQFQPVALLCGLAMVVPLPVQGSEPAHDPRLAAAESTKAEMKLKFEQCLKQHPGSSHCLKALGQILVEEDTRSSQAGKLFAKATRVAPRDPEARYLYGQWACLNNQEDLCLAELAKALALTPQNDQARMQINTLIGIAEEKLNHPARAEAAFRRALEFNRQLKSPNSLAALQFVEFLVKHARDGEAERVIDETLKWTPTLAPAHFERAKLLARRGQSEKAIEATNLALKHAGTHQAQLRALHAFLAKTYFALGRVEEAQVHQRWIEAH